MSSAVDRRYLDHDPGPDVTSDADGASRSGTAQGGGELEAAGELSSGGTAVVDLSDDALQPVPPPNALLVAVDFSPASLRALDLALSWRSAESDVTVLHVVDAALADRVHGLGICSIAEAIARQRTRAEQELAALATRGRFEPMIVEGIPFAEIVKVAAESGVRFDRRWHPWQRTGAQPIALW